MKFRVFLILSLFFVSCCTVDKSASEYGSDTLSITGTMRRLSLEGGCWQFMGDDGTAYQISGTGQERLLHDGLRADLIVREMRGQRTVCMTGKTVQLITIIKLY